MQVRPASASPNATEWRPPRSADARRLGLGTGERGEDSVCCDAQAWDDSVMGATRVWEKPYLEKLSDILFLSDFLESSFDRVPGVPECHTTNEQTETRFN